MTALAALFPGKNITASMVGNGIAGIVVSVVRIITKATLSNADNSYEISGILYFSIAGFTILLCIVGSVVLLRLNLTRVILEENEKHRIEGQKKTRRTSATWLGEQAYRCNKGCSTCCS